MYLGIDYTAAYKARVQTFWAQYSDYSNKNERLALFFESHII